MQRPRSRVLLIIKRMPVEIAAHHRQAGSTRQAMGL